MSSQRIPGYPGITLDVTPTLAFLLFHWTLDVVKIGDSHRTLQSRADGPEP